MASVGGKDQERKEEEEVRATAATEEVERSAYLPPSQKKNHRNRPHELPLQQFDTPLETTLTWYLPPSCFPDEN